MLKKTPISPPEDEIPSEPPVCAPHNERSVLFTSTPRSILRSISRPSLELADTTFKTLQTGARQHTGVYLIASRSVCHFRPHFGLAKSVHARSSQIRSISRSSPL